MTTSIDRVVGSHDWNQVTTPPQAIREATGALVAAQGPGALTVEQLASLVEGLTQRADLWRPLVVTDARRRRYRLIYDDDRIDVWVLSWMPGQHTGFHDHGDAGVALAAVDGHVVERQMRVTGGAHEQVLQPGRVQVGAPGYIHSVAHGAGEPAVTIHAYSPPLVEVGQYRATEDGLLVRERQHGRQELLDHTIATLLDGPPA